MSDRDFTINEFANASRGRVKNKKALGRQTSKYTVTDEEKKKLPRSRRKQKAEDKTQDDTGFDYPIDLWYLLSEYIQPEAVGKFASLCKSSYHVVKTAKFWFHLYKQYYKKVDNIPQRLRRECMDQRPYNLRACTIRSLHFTYFSSFDRVGNNQYLEQEQPHSLVNRRCCLMWHKKGESRWYYYFKLKQSKKQKMPLDENIENCNFNSDLHEMIKNVWANSEEGCRILRVACSKFGLIPLVNGLILQKVKLDLSPGFNHHRLQLSFGTSFISSTTTQVVVLSGVADCKVLDWWHPCYPHQETASTLLDSAPDSWDSPDNSDEFVSQDFSTLQIA